jgi:hypothetical protein
VAHVYGFDRHAPIDNRVIEVKDYVSNQLRVHPAHVKVVGLAGAGPGKTRAEGAHDGKTFAVSVELRGSDVLVTPAG